MFNEVIKTIEWNGKILELSTGKFARQADGAVMVRYGDSAILCTTVSAKKVKDDANFFPLTVNYQEKTHAVGRIPGGYLKREGRGSEREVLVSRLIDRPIRPLFHSGFFNETQVLCNVHSYDVSGNVDILALIGASAALAISGVPYLDIAAASRVGYIDGRYVLNPTEEQLRNSKLDLVVAGTTESVMMVESEADMLTEAQMLDAIKFGHEALAPVIEMIKDLKNEAGKPAWEINDLYPITLKQQINKIANSAINNAFNLKSKQERNAAISDIMANVNEILAENNHEYSKLQIDSAFYDVKAEVLRNNTLEKQTRIDGRALDEIRQIACEVDVLPKTHGSALFTRGETQGLVTATLGTGQDEQFMESLEGEYKENFLLNYIFPQYSVGEVGPLRAPSRREIGHGKLAWRALKKALPAKADFPYTIRVVSEITESNGSSSMATVCGASMAMMNAGIPLTSPISGIAMGLIKEGDKFVVLSDIIADEDSLGDMDFKVAGSAEGVTALQMDIKVAGITFDIMDKALEQAKRGRVHILGKMSEAISAQGALSDNAPVIISFTVNKDKIREIIGPGGKVIREICDSTGAKIDITDEGQVSVSAVGKDKLDAAVKKIKEIAFDPEIGDIFNGKVVKVLESGAFVNYLGSRDGFVHISEIAQERVESVASHLKEGQIVKVKLIGFDRGKAKLTIKNADKDALMPKSDNIDNIKNQEVKVNENNQSPEVNKISDKENIKPVKPKAKTREVAKKWQDTKTSPLAEDVKERKYFN